MEKKGLKCRLYPTDKQIQHFKQEVGNQRFLWNNFLERNIDLYEKSKKFLFHFDMNYLLLDFKKEKDFLKIGYSQSLQTTLKYLSQAIVNCYKSGFGFPKFKRYNVGDSYTLLQHFRINGNKLHIPKLGKVRIKIHRAIKKNETIKNITIIREGDLWYASLNIEFEPKKLPKTKKSIGLDAGSVRTITDSEGNFKKAIRNLPYVKEVFVKISDLQRKLSSKFEAWKERTGREKPNKGEIISNSYVKLRNKINKLHRKIRNQRMHELHELSAQLVNEYDIIVVEDLKLKNMTKSSKGTEDNPGKNVKQKTGLNRNLLTNALGTLFRLIEYKSNWYGKTFIKVDPKYTSQTCSRCGKRHKDSRKTQSIFECIFCGFKINADTNAAINIENKGLEIAA